MKRTVTSVAAVACLAAVASADTVELDYLGNGVGRNVEVNLRGDTQAIFAGQLRHDFANGTGSLAQFNGQTLLTYCTDVEQGVSDDAVLYTLTDLELLPQGGGPETSTGMGAVRAAAIQSLFAYAEANGGDHLSSTAVGSFGAAFQLAIWEIVYDYDGTAASLDITGGDFTSTRTNGNPLWAPVQNFLATLFNDAVTFDTGADLVGGLASADQQDQLVQFPPTTVIPTPAAATMGLLGLGAIAARRRR